MVIDNYNFVGEISGFGTIKMLVMSRSVNMNRSPNNFLLFPYMRAAWWIIT
jgi:hypothetical protein